MPHPRGGSDATDVDDSLVGEDSKYFAVGLAFLMPSHHLPDGNNYYPFNIFA